MQWKSSINTTKLKPMVAAIDFGEASSGYAWLANNNFEKYLNGDISTIYIKTWEREEGLSYKAPTSVLFRPDKTFHSFGFDAENYYHEHSDDVDFKEWYFFKKLKMKIYIDKDGLTEDTIIEDSKEAGNRMKVVDVFAAIIKYFKENLLECFKSINDEKEYFANNDFHWVIIVPVFWDLKAKQLMKDAAEKAGISGDQLTLALEPEAAFSYCRNFLELVGTTKDGENAFDAMKIGSQYIVFNSSATSTDITVYESTGPNTLDEIYQVCGGRHYRGNTVNAKFLKFLTNLFGGWVIKQIRDKHPSEYFDFMETFEHKKTSFSADDQSMVTIRIPVVWMEIFEDNTGETLEEALLISPFKDTVKINKDKLRIRNDLFRQFFNNPIKYVLRVLGKLFEKTAITNLITLLAVGGNSASSVIINAIKQKFPNLSVIVPKSPDLAVLRGGVLYGFQHYTVTKRERQEEDVNEEETLKGLGLEDDFDLEDIFAKHQKSFWNRVYLVGPYSIGKSCLAKILVGEPVPTIRESTDGIWIYMGKAGMDIDKMEWVFFKKGNAITQVLTNMLMSMSTYEKGVNVNSSVYDDTLDEITPISESAKSKFEDSAKTIQISSNLKGATTDDITSGNTSHKIKNQQLPEKVSSNKNLSDHIHNTTSLNNQTYAEKSQKEKNKEKKQNVTVVSDNSECEWIKEITTNMSPDKIHELIVKAVEEGKYKQKIVPIDIWDFGGQKDYYMTHQLFITSRGIFVLMFNGSIALDKHMPDLTFLPGHFGKPTVAVYLLHWVNSILTYCKRTNGGFPKIIFVATHKDERWFQWTQEARRNQLETELQQLFEKHGGLEHLEFKPLIFVDATNPEDPEIADLRERLMQRATEHPRWGEPMPTRWIPLELQLSQKSSEGINIISYEQLLILNTKNESMILSERHLAAFLKFQHSLGKLLYFDVANLRDFIILSPAYLVEVLRSIVTEERFWPKGEMYSTILKNLQETGMIERGDIYYLWEQDNFKHILSYKEYMIQILVHLDILITPKTSSEDVNIEDVSQFLVPCMISKKNDTMFLQRFLQSKTSIIIAFTFIEDVIPPALSYRFLSSLITTWKIKIYRGRYKEKRMLFSDLAVIQIDSCHDVAVQVKTNKIIVSLIHAKTKEDIIPTIASSLQECLMAAVVGISEFYSKLSEGSKSVIPFTIEFGVFCKSDLCFFNHNEMPLPTDDPVWICKKHKQRHATKGLTVWFSEKEHNEECTSTCKGLGRLEKEQCPLPQHIRRLSTLLSLDECREIAILLDFQLQEWNDLEYQFLHQSPNDIKFTAVWSCMIKTGNFSFDKLQNVLEIKRISSHLLCQVFRDVKIDGLDMAEETLNKIPSVDALHDLSNHIGNSTMQLAIELDVDLSYIQQLQHDHKNKLLEQTRKVLMKWRQNKFPKPTILRLLKALYRVGKFGPTYQIIKNHLRLE